MHRGSRITRPTWKENFRKGSAHPGSPKITQDHLGSRGPTSPRSFKMTAHSKLTPGSPQTHPRLAPDRISQDVQDHPGSPDPCGPITPQTLSGIFPERVSWPRITQDDPRSSRIIYDHLIHLDSSRHKPFPEFFRKGSPHPRSLRIKPDHPG